MIDGNVSKMDKLWAFLGGLVFCALVVTCVALAAGPQPADADVVMEQRVDVVRYDTGIDGVKLTLVDTPYALCFYTSSTRQGVYTSAPYCLSKVSK